MSDHISAFGGTAVAPDDDLPPVEEASRAPKHLGLALAVLSVSQLMIVLDATVVNIALPAIRDELGFSAANLSWVVTGYTLAFGGLLLLGGRTGDLFGRRRMFMIGVGVFAVASLLGGLAQSEAWLLGARVLQGLGGAIAAPTALALITTNFPAGAARNRAFAVFAAVSGVGAAVGLLLGGVLTEVSWRWTLFVNVPIGIAVIVLASRVLYESNTRRIALDVPGALTATFGLVAIVYGLINSAQADGGWDDPVTIGSLVLGVVLLTMFVVIESRTSHPLVPLRLLANRTRAVTYVTMLTVGAAMFGMFFFLSLFVQNILGYSPVKAGLAFLPFSFGVVISAQVASRLAPKVDPRFIAGAGGVLGTIGLFWFSRIEATSTYWSALFPPIIVMSLGMGLLFVTLTLTAVANVSAEDTGVASALLNTTQQVGGSLGLALLTTVFTSGLNDEVATRKADIAAQVASGAITPQQAQGLGKAIPAFAQTAGSTSALLLAAGLMATAAIVVIVGLNARRQDLGTMDAAAAAG